ncbi:MAG: hypothetical protein DRQ39_03510 [Gammaproteobacteria bacterium]|nr:MAG: hypothetical protein DRQ39_03510 [Gammaproteobacteria bacterium]
MIEEKKDGDCFKAAADRFMDAPGQHEVKVEVNLMVPKGELLLFHGVVTRHTDGREHVHAWLQWNKGELVFDFSNGNQVIAPIALYYKAGDIDYKRCRSYTFAEARRHMLDTGHYGPWAEELEL